MDRASTRAIFALAGLGLAVSGCASTRSERPEAETTNGSIASEENVSSTSEEMVSTESTIQSLENNATSGPKDNKGTENNPNNNSNRNPENKPNIYSIVRYIGVDANTWKEGEATQNYSDLYTRILLTTAPSPWGEMQGAGTGTPLRNYRAEQRDWLERLWASQTDTVTTVAKVKLLEPNLNLTIPLYSVSHASGRKLGNSWSTFFTLSDVESPLFKIGPNTRMTLHLTVKASTDLKSQGASLALGAVTAAVKIAAPTAGLLTTLSAPQAGKTAAAIDDAVSSLLSRDIGEDIEVGRLADSWGKDSGITLTGCAPFVRIEGDTPPPSTGADGTASRWEVPSRGDKCAQDLDLDHSKNVPIGRWTLKLSCPRLSAFDSRDICHPLGSIAVAAQGMLDLSTRDLRQAAQKVIADAMRDDTILSFEMASQVPLQSYVQSQPWFTTFIPIANNKRPEDYGTFCAAAILHLGMDGLNEFDSGLALRAIIRHMPQFEAFRSEFATGKAGAACPARLDRLGIGDLSG